MTVPKVCAFLSLPLLLPVDYRVVYFTYDSNFPSIQQVGYLTPIEVS